MERQKWQICRLLETHPAQEQVVNVTKKLPGAAPFQQANDQFAVSEPGMQPCSLASLLLETEAQSKVTSSCHKLDIEQPAMPHAKHRD